MSARIAAVMALSSAAFVLAVSCHRDELAPCKIDTDCPTGSFCRDELCAIVARDASAFDSGTFVCAGPGDVCSIDSDCCSPPCSSRSGRCAGGGTSSGGTSGGGTSGASGTSGTSGTSGASGSTCQPLYGLCSIDNDCCSPLLCGSNGFCQ